MGRAALAGTLRPPDPREGWIRSFSRGFEYYLAGFKFISAHPRLLRYILIPLLISFLLFAGLVAGSFFLIPHVLAFLDGEWIALLEWLRHVIYWLSAVLLGLLCILASFFATLFLSTVINSPFYDLLSEKVEEIYLGRPLEEKWSLGRFVRSILIPLRESLKLALFEAVITLLLFAISLLSAGLGTVLFALAGPYLASLTAFDFIMARKYYSLAEKRRFMRRHQPFAMGFGTPAYLLPFLTPFAVAGATLGFLAAPVK
jgi:CysZ protein